MPRNQILQAKFFVTPDGVAVPRAKQPSKTLRFAIFDRDGWQCRYCGVPVTVDYLDRRDSTKVRASLDHVFPISRGGQNDPDNLVTACEPCNYSKGASKSAEQTAALPPEQQKILDVVTRGGSVVIYRRPDGRDVAELRPDRHWSPRKRDRTPPVGTAQWMDVNGLFKRGWLREILWSHTRRVGVPARIYVAQCSDIPQAEAA